MMLLKQFGFKVIVVTNQPDIGYGLIITVKNKKYNYHGKFLHAKY